MKICTRVNCLINEVHCLRPWTVTSLYMFLTIILLWTIIVVVLGTINQI